MISAMKAEAVFVAERADGQPREGEARMKSICTASASQNGIVGKAGTEVKPDHRVEKKNKPANLKVNKQVVLHGLPV